MKTLDGLLTRTLEFLLAAALLAIAGIIITLVVMRYCFNASATGANELVTILFAYATSLGAALTLRRNEHIAISFAVDQLSESKRHYVDRFVLILIAFLNLILVVESFGWIHVTGDYLMPATGWPRRISQNCIPVGCGIAFLFCLVRLWLPESDASSTEELGA